MSSGGKLKALATEIRTEELIEDIAESGDGAHSPAKDLKDVKKHADEEEYEYGSDFDKPEEPSSSATDDTEYDVDIDPKELKQLRQLYGDAVADALLNSMASRSRQSIVNMRKKAAEKRNKKFEGLVGRRSPVRRRAQRQFATDDDEAAFKRRSKFRNRRAASTEAESKERANFVDRMEAKEDSRRKELERKRYEEKVKARKQFRKAKKWTAETGDEFLRRLQENENKRKQKTQKLRRALAPTSKFVGAGKALSEKQRKERQAKFFENLAKKEPELLKQVREERQPLTKKRYEEARAQRALRLAAAPQVSKPEKKKPSKGAARLAGNRR